MKRKESIFWNLYAWCYDALSRLLPYQGMMKTIAARIHPTDYVFDAACGTGNLASHLPCSCSYVGMDLSSAMLTRARKKHPQTRFVQADLNQPIDLRDNTFDVVCCVNAVYAVSNPRALIQELLRVLKPGGLLIISTPKAKPKMGQILREHVGGVGWWQTLPLIPVLLLIALFNILILARGKKQTYHFFREEEIRGLILPEELLSVYGKQNWLAIRRK